MMANSLAVPRRVKKHGYLDPPKVNASGAEVDVTRGRSGTMMSTYSGFGDDQQGAGQHGVGAITGAYDALNVLPDQRVRTNSSV